LGSWGLGSLEIWDLGSGPNVGIWLLAKRRGQTSGLEMPRVAQFSKALSVPASARPLLKEGEMQVSEFRMTMPVPVRRLPVVLLLVAATAAIATALAFEHLGGYAPCPLCLIQRYAYYFAIPVVAATLVAQHRHKRLAAAVLLGLVAIAFAINAGLGAYHSGVEWGLWPGPTSCAGGGNVSGTARGLLDGGIADANVVRCDVAPWRFLGLSFAGWNVLISAGLSLLALFSASKILGRAGR